MKINNPSYIFIVGIVINVLMELFTEYFNYLCDVVNYIINYCIMNVEQILVYYQKLWTISFQMIPYLPQLKQFLKLTRWFT